MTNVSNNYFGTSMIDYSRNNDNQTLSNSRTTTRYSRTYQSSGYKEGSYRPAHQANRYQQGSYQPTHQSSRMRNTNHKN